jgi:hypothetical protein
VTRSWLLGLSAALACGSSSGLPAPDNLGERCVPNLEQSAAFSGFSEREASLDHDACGDAVCLVNHFRGRVSCPYGQSEGESKCQAPGSGEPVTVPVSPQLLARTAARAVYCSCRCAGPEAGADYCECPDGYECSEIVPSLGVGPASVTGSYCIKNGTAYSPSTIDISDRCDERVAPCR